MTRHYSDQPRYIFRNRFSGARLIITTKEAAERLAATMPSWELSES